MRVAIISTRLPDSKPVVKSRSVIAGYRAGHPVITNLDLAVAGPEQIAIVGRNGCRKSTLLNLISARLTPWSGQVDVVANCAMLDQRVGILDPALSVRENFPSLNLGAA